MMRARGVGSTTIGSRRAGWVFCLSTVGLLLVGCAEPPAPPVETDDASTPPGASAPVSDFQQFTLTLPYGDPDAGREAFVDLQCTVCHRVAGEDEFPAPYGDYQGPMLTSVLASRPPEYVATAMIAPSHSISLEVSDELRARIGGQPSPMADFSYAMSVRQMLDLLAFLTTLEE